jgi:hypothetical protein
MENNYTLANIKKQINPTIIDFKYVRAERGLNNIQNV